MLVEAKSEEPKNFLEDLRKEFPKIAIQILSADAVYNPEHLKWVVRQSWLAKERGIMLAKRVELDILMRVAVSSQISDAIEIAGAKRNHRFIVIGIGAENELQNLFSSVKKKCKIIPFPSAGQRQVLTRFRITEKEIDASGQGKEPLLLAEKGLLELLEKL